MPCWHALIARNQTLEMPYYVNLALDNDVKPTYHRSERKQLRPYRTACLQSLYQYHS